LPAWTNDPNTPINSLIPGVPAYSAGSRPNTPRGKFLITQTAVAANVVTLTGALVEGNTPSIGDLIYVYKTTRGAGALNTTVAIAISAVSINALTGVGTISYPVTTGNLGTASDPGYAFIDSAEVAEASVPNQGYTAFAIPRPTSDIQDRSMTITVSYPSAPAAILFSLQGAPRNVDTEYIDLIKNETAAGTYSDSGASGSSSTQLWPGAWNFARYKDKGSSGGSSPTVIAKLLLS